MQYMCWYEYFFEVCDLRKKYSIAKIKIKGGLNLNIEATWTNADCLLRETIIEKIKSEQ
jgi:hypothetical protein